MKYILQKNDGTCFLITIMNALIHKQKNLPFKYNSKKFKKFILKKLDGYQYPLLGFEENKKNIKKIEKKFGVKLISFKNYNIQCLSEIKMLMIEQLKKGNLIEFTVDIPTFNAHSFLIVDFEIRSNCFKCINLCLNSTKTIEYHPFEILGKLKPKPPKSELFDHLNTNHYSFNKNDCDYSTIMRSNIIEI